jgi:hypothetical protein
LKPLSEKNAGNTGHVSDHNEIARRLQCVLDFGAYGDGIHDDTLAVQNAINTGSVYFPNGIYKITDTLVFDPSGDVQGLRIRGGGLSANLDNQVANGSLLKIGGSLAEINTVEYQWFGSIKYINIKTTSSKQCSSGIEISKSWLGEIKHTRITGLSGDAIKIVNTANDLDSLNNFVIDSCDLRNNGGAGVNCDLNAGCSAIGLLDIRNSYICSNLNSGIKWMGTQGNICNCQIANNTGSGLVILHMFPCVPIHLIPLFKFEQM